MFRARITGTLCVTAIALLAALFAAFAAAQSQEPQEVHFKSGSTSTVFRGGLRAGI